MLLSFSEFCFCDALSTTSESRMPSSSIFSCLLMSFPENPTLPLIGWYSLSSLHHFLKFIVDEQGCWNDGRLLISTQIWMFS